MELGSRKSTVKVPADQMSGEGLLLASQMSVFSVSSHGGRGQESSLGSYKGINPIHDGSTLMT